MHRITLNNGQTIQIKGKYRHFGSNTNDYLILDQSGREYTITENELAALTVRHRTTDQKLSLYMEYFAGRKDVYAQKWSNGKGYSPALTNWYEFFQARNDRHKRQSITKHYATYTKKVVYQQISSADQYHHFGIYPLLPGDVTRLLVFDFDKHSSPVDPSATTKAVLATCNKYGIDSLPEVSSSGNSFHLWIFFREPVKANRVRQLGKLILLEAMASSDSVNLSCFDRMVPTQDRLPKKGFGNLIALPLKWSEVQENRSTFTDHDLHPLQPSLLFEQLAQTKRYSSSELDVFINIIINDIGMMPGQEDPLTYLRQQALPKKVNGYIGGEIFIRRTALTHADQLSLLSLATFANPEFIKKQQMRVPVWNIPSMLTAASVTRKYICLPRGILSQLKAQCRCHFTTRFTKVPTLHIEFRGQLRADQQKAVTSIQHQSTGIICAHTGFGKTVVGCALIAIRKVPTVVIVPTSNIAKQWQNKASQFLKIEDQPFPEKTPTGRNVKKQQVEIINGIRNHPSRLVDIVNIRKLARMSAQERSDFYQNYGQIIVDECQHISAVTFEDVLSQANVKYIVGLTATPERSDGLQQFVYYRCGKIVYQSQAQDNTLIHRYLYPRYSGVGEIPRVTVAESYSQKIADLVNDDDRNQQIVNDIEKCLADHRHILLLSNRIQHLKKLKKMLNQDVEHNKLHLIVGSEKAKLEITDSTAAYVILSTNRYVGEGFDLPSLDTLFFALPFSWKGNTKQFLGRLERGLEQKDELRVFDYVDIADPIFAKMFRKRARVYKQSGYEFVTPTGQHSYRSGFYTSSDYLPVWENDLQTGQEILLITKKISKQLIQRLNKLTNEGKRVELQTPMNNLIHGLLLPAIHVKLQNVPGNNACIVDHRICWYGDINFDGNSYSGSSAVRIVNEHLSKKMLKNDPSKRV